jgi:hypothetical protein
MANPVASNFLSGSEEMLEKIGLPMKHTLIFQLGSTIDLNGGVKKKKKLKVTEKGRSINSIQRRR